MEREILMKNNTKLIMETWRRFLKEEVLEDEPEEGYYDEDYNLDGLNPDDYDQGVDEPLPGEPPFENNEPVTDVDMSEDDLPVDTLSLIRQGAPKHIVNDQARKEGLTPSQVHELRSQFEEEMSNAFDERYDMDSNDEDQFGDF
jgi:hypothetical protein